MIRLQIGSDQQIDEPTSDDIADSITALDSGSSAFISLLRDHEQEGFAKAIRLQPGLFLIEYSDSYGHMAAEDPLDSEALTTVLNAYANGDLAWMKEFSWAPVEM